MPNTIDFVYDTRLLWVFPSAVAAHTSESAEEPQALNAAWEEGTRNVHVW